MSQTVFGLIDESYLSSSSDEKEEEKIQCQSKKSKTEIQNDLKQRFESLKERRLRIKSKNDRKLERKLKNKLTSVKTTSLKVSVDNNTKTSHLNLNVPLLGEELSDLNRLEEKIEKAIEQKNIELAEKISDELNEKQTELVKTKMENALNYESKRTSKNNLKTDNTKKPFWRFEAKQKWESKANM